MQIGKQCIHLFFVLQLSIITNKYSIASAPDTLKNGRLSTKNDTWFLNSETEKHYAIDSSIFNIEEYNVVQRNGVEYNHAGNFGNAAYPIIYEPNKNLNFNLGYNQFDLYRYQRDSIRYYQVIRPYTELSMLISIKNEQMFHGIFANQHKGIIYYGVDFRRIYSKGIYDNQRTNDNSFYIYGIFNSRNKRWNVRADLVFNAFKCEENGGTPADVFESSYFQKTLAPVNVTTPENDYRQVDFYLTSSFNIGKKYTERVNDSTTRQVVLPQFKISYQFNTESNKHKFLDSKPDEDYYGNFFLSDSVFNYHNYLKFGNALMLEYRWKKLTSDSTFADKNFILSAEAGYDYFISTQNEINNRFGNFYVSGTVRSNFASQSKIIYRGIVKYFPYGWNQNDFLADGYAGYDFGKIGTLTGNFTFSQKESPYTFERFDGHPLSWIFSLPKTKVVSSGAKFQNWTFSIPSQKIQWGFQADFNYNNVQYMPSYPGTSNPYLTSSFEKIFVLHAANKNSFYGVHFDNDGYYTIFADEGYLKKTLPVFYLKSSVYYEARVFKKALWLTTGFDLRYRYNSNVPYYDPLLGVFYPVNGGVRKTYPVLDFFINFKIKTVRVFLKLDNISSYFGPKGYYSLYSYPAPDMSFRVGLSWRFFE